MILTLAVTGGGAADRDRFTRMVAGALKISEVSAGSRRRDGHRAAAAHHRPPGGDGHRHRAPLHSRIRAATAEITQQLWGDLPAEDLATAGRVLAIITERANAQLAR